MHTTLHKRYVTDTCTRKLKKIILFFFSFDAYIPFKNKLKDETTKIKKKLDIFFKTCRYYIYIRKQYEHVLFVEFKCNFNLTLSFALKASLC